MAGVANYLSPYPTTSDMRGLGAWVATPGYILEQIRALDAEYQVVGRELRAQIEECLPDKPDATTSTCIARRAFAEQVWTPLKAAWDDFVANHRAWYNRLWGGTVDVVDSYRQRLRDLRGSARGAGYDFRSPDPRSPPTSSWSRLGDAIRFAAVAGIVIGGIFVVHKVLPRGR